MFLIHEIYHVQNNRRAKCYCVCLGTWMGRKSHTSVTSPAVGRPMGRRVT